MNERKQLRIDILMRVGDSSSRIIALGQKDDHDGRLAELTKGLGQLAVEVQWERNMKEWLVRIAAFCIGWAEHLSGGVNKGKILDLIMSERSRQEHLFAKGTFLFTCGCISVDPKRKLRVLMEEVGEVAKEIDELERSPKKTRIPFVQELVQVAAVCVGWIESLEVKP